MNFFINEILKDVTNDKLSRILWIDDNNTIAYIIDLNDDKALPVKRMILEIREVVVTGNLIKLKDDPFIVNAIEEYTQKHIDSRDQAWQIIKEMVLNEPGIYEKNIRAAYIKKARETYGVSYPTVRKYLCKYWQRGKTINALLPDYQNSGAKGEERTAGTKKRGRPPKYAATGVNVDEKTKKLFRVALEKYYLTSKENRLTDAYKMMVKEFYAKDIYYENGIEKVIIQDEEKMPSIRQFRYWYEKEYTVPESLNARKGRKKYNKDHRAVLGSSLSEVFGPGSRYQIDATVGDVYLISKHNPNWIIGRPVIYLVMDVFSRMVVGIYIGLEGPSWIGAMMALANTVMDKREFCAQYGIEISKDDWPCEHLPEILLADRGELEGFNVDRLIEAFNLHVENAAPYRAEWKGVVEKHFDLIQKKVKPMLPGYVDKDFQERGARDYRLDAVLTLDEFTKIIIKQILYYNQKHYLKDYVRNEDLVHDDVLAIPLKLWNWGIENRTGKLKYSPEDIVKLHLMPRETATVTYKGIRMKGIYYSCERAVKELWFETARQKGSWKVEIAYDPRDMSIAYWIDSHSNEYDKCFMLEPSKRYEHSSLEEVMYLVEKEKQLAQSVSHQQLQKDVDYIAEVESIVANASKRKEKLKDQTLSKAEKVGSIKEHRRNEKQSLKSEEAFQFEKEKEGQMKEAQVFSFQSNKENNQDFSRPNLRDYLNRRKEKRDE